MGAHGYHRHTDDVDAFVEYDVRGKWFRALKEQGLTIAPVFTGVHYIAYLPKHQNPDIRIDVLLPAEDPDVSAIMVPESGTIAERPAEIWPLDLLVIAKFRAKRPKDRADVDEMYERGLFDPVSVRNIMLHMQEESLASSFWKKYGGST